MSFFLKPIILLTLEDGPKPHFFNTHVTFFYFVSSPWSQQHFLQALGFLCKIVIVTFLSIIKWQLIQDCIWSYNRGSWRVGSMKVYSKQRFGEMQCFRWNWEWWWWWSILEKTSNLYGDFKSDDHIFTGIRVTYLLS